MTVNETINTQSKKSRLPIYIGIGCGVIFLCILACLAFYFFFIRGVRGEPANVDTIQKVTREFVSVLHDKQYSTAQSMFSDKILSNISLADLETLANLDPIATYQRLSVCEFQVFYVEAGKQVVGIGIIRYKDGLAGFESDLLQDEDGTWKMYGFFLKPDISTTPWGACKYEQP